MTAPQDRKSSQQKTDQETTGVAQKYGCVKKVVAPKPDEAACQLVRTRLEPDGFSVDAKPMAEKTDLPFSLHASKSMRLIVPDMQDLSQRMTTLAGEFGGRYDGWAA